MKTAEQIAYDLSRPFEPREIRWKPQTVKKDGTAALAVAYLDARAIMYRLDAVLGVDGWQDSYEVLENHSVLCQLRLRIAGEWIIKSDIGSPSEQPDEGDRLKAAVSDALKRAAVKAGVGRYLYRLPIQWVPYDSQRRQFSQTPTLPDWAVPKPAPKAEPPKAAEQPKPAEEPKKVEEPKPAAETINQQQAAELMDMIRAARITNQVFLSEFSITRLGELRVDQVEDAKRILRNLIAKARKGAA